MRKSQKSYADRIRINPFFASLIGQEIKRVDEALSRKTQKEDRVACLYGNYPK